MSHLFVIFTTVDIQIKKTNIRNFRSESMESQLRATRVFAKEKGSKKRKLRIFSLTLIDSFSVILASGKVYLLFYQIKHWNLILNNLCRANHLDIFFFSFLPSAVAEVRFVWKFASFDTDWMGEVNWVDETKMSVCSFFQISFDDETWRRRLLSCGHLASCVQNQLSKRGKKCGK